MRMNCDIMSDGYRKVSRRSCLKRCAVASSLQRKSRSFSFLDANMEGGDVLMFVTWSELIELLFALITLAFVIMSYLNSKKR